MKKVSPPSEQTKTEAMNIAKATQKPGQTKEQTKIIAQGIEKGITLYKKQQKEKQRQTDKEKKKREKEKRQQTQTEQESTHPNTLASPEKTTNSLKPAVPWILAAIGWGLFAIQWVLTQTHS
ncbi:DUF2956 family protein [Vibrio mangrovi]|uniref:DUF2956 family protein n=1 Tax=Vibrio mangrovi TaxID=474394 RepID=A0A1Y6IS12_9VIBR|nr:DUF2956 family protein [Vibrio mangrovi]MDW6001529.1 DUF2956 family protein [Vibrio mangrovi]SMS00447.1 hypothetical protein VIM7927_01713 [Vibrio mangrovi]